MVGTIPSLLNCSTFLRGTILHLLLGTQRLYQHMDQSVFFAFRAGGCHISHPHRDTLVSLHRGHLYPCCRAGAVPGPGCPVRRAWHYLGEGGFAPATEWWGACQQLRKLHNPTPVLEAMFALSLQVQPKSLVLTTDEDDQTGLENLESASHHPSF